MSYQWMDIYSDSFEPPTIKLKETPSPIGFTKIPSGSGGGGRNGKQKQAAVAIPTKKDSNKADAELKQLRFKQNWEFCYSPLKNVPMNLIMSYFAPNSVQMIPIMMTFNLLISPITDIFMNVGKIDEFEYDGDNAMQMFIMMKLCYIGSCLCNLAIGVWKLNKMKLIPNTTSDWLSWEVAQKVLERT